MNPSALPKQWRTEAELLRRRHDERAAKIIADLAQELEDALHNEQMEAVTLDEAHAIGGYSVDHLRRELREGRIPNAGRKGSPRILRKDIPVKAGHQRNASSLSISGASSPGARARRAAVSHEIGR